MKINDTLQYKTKKRTTALLTFILVLFLQALLPIMITSNDQKGNIMPLSHQPEFYPNTSYGYVTREDAITVWEKIQDYRIIKGIEGNIFSIMIFLHHYSVEGLNPMTAEWIIIIHSKPLKDVSNAKISLIRLNFETLEVKGLAQFPFKKQINIDRFDAVKVINDHPLYKHMVWKISSGEIDLVGDNYFYFKEASDFGGTLVVNKTSGKLLFSATTIADGSGKLIFPNN
ncbi:MAG: hypothetical protein IMF01_08550 [Proteobacteria bacterium]|nr:hypothetical protein [Pseudomonadota bacterium]